VTQGAHRSIGLYAVAFVLLLVGAALIVGASLGSLQSPGLLWWSMGASYTAIVLAILSLLLVPSESR